MFTRAALCLSALAGLAASTAIHGRPASENTRSFKPATPVSICLAEGTKLTPELQAKLRAVNQAIGAYLGVDPEADPNDPFADRYNLNSRWTGSQGAPRVITWSFVPDTVSITGAPGISEPTSNSSLFATMDAGVARATWVAQFQSCFDRWEALTGIDFQRITSGGNDWDDGASWTSSGSAARGDMRIGMHPIDGGSGILAYCYFPQNGNMVLDKNDSGSFLSASSTYRFLRNTVAHEMGHGIGLNHVCSSNSSQLMEPFLSTSFDGPRHDDVRGVQRHYGDINEPDNDAASAVSSGAIAPSATRTLGTIPGVAIPTSSTLSIDADGEIDYHSFSTSQILLATFTLTPVGALYDSSTQNEDGSCNSGNNINSLGTANLAFDIRNSADALVTTVSSAAVGVAETISGVLLSPPGTQLVKVYEVDAPTASQMYTLTITTAAAPTVTASDTLPNYVSLSWTNIPNNTGYTVKRNTVNSEAGAATVGTPGTNSFMDTTAPDNATLFYFVYATQFGSSKLVGSDSGFAKCSGDLNNDGQVNDADFVIFVTAYNMLLCSDPSMPSGCPADLNRDTFVDDSDFSIFVGAYDNLICP
ncbi:MAG: matrixin family metalloprotease [Planctomycetes bacterium]|nr:matrixin family metalloprotease [Planctomycetota bacterium]